jgi:hypothetical protein
MRDEQLDILIDKNDEVIKELKRLKEIISEIELPKIPEKVSIQEAETLIEKIQSIIDIIQKIKISEQNKVDLSPLIDLLKQIKDKKIEFNLKDVLASLEKIKNSIQEINTSSLEKLLKDIVSSIQKIKLPEIKDYTDELQKIRDAIKNIRIGFAVPSIMGVKNSADTRINPATEETLQKSLGLSGTGVDTTFTLTNANTSYAIPTNPPIDFYSLVIYNASDTDIYLRFTSGTTAGIKIASDTSFAIDLGGGQQVYVYCDSANKTINLSYKTI